MQTKAITISLLLILLLSLPLPALAFWGSDGSDPSSLNLQSGYDVNTVTTVSGRIIAIKLGEERPNVELELASSGVRTVICIGPQRYWAKTGVPFKTGDEVTVRGSMAQGSEGIIYIMAQKITTATPDVTFVLRDEAGCPAWAGHGVRRGQCQQNNQAAPVR